MSEEKKYKPFPIQATDGNIYQVTIKSIKAEPADRYGWKKDHLAIWLDFSPTVGATLGTFIELPIKDYVGAAFLVAIMNEAQQTVNRILVDYEKNKKDQEAEEIHKSKLDSYAARVSLLLESEKVPK